MAFLDIHTFFLFFFPLGVFFVVVVAFVFFFVFFLFVFLQQQHLSSIAVVFNLTGHADRVWPLSETSHCSSLAHYSDSTQQILQNP